MNRYEVTQTYTDSNLKNVKKMEIVCRPNDPRSLGFVVYFANGKTLEGWRGEYHNNPYIYEFGQKNQKKFIESAREMFGFDAQMKTIKIPKNVFNFIQKAIENEDPTDAKHYWEKASEIYELFKLYTPSTIPNPSKNYLALKEKIKKLPEYDPYEDYDPDEYCHNEGKCVGNGDCWECDCCYSDPEPDQNQKWDDMKKDIVRYSKRNDNWKITIKEKNDLLRLLQQTRKRYE